MDEVEITLRMPRALWEAASRLATRRGVPMEQMMRQTLSAELLRTKGTLGVTPMAQLRGQLTGDFEKAASWAELQGRLMLKGYVLQDRKEGLCLYTHPDGRRLCEAIRLGIDADKLTRKFGQPFPSRARQQVSDSLRPHVERPQREELVAKWPGRDLAQPAPDGATEATRLVRHV